MVKSTAKRLVFAAAQRNVFVAWAMNVVAYNCSAIGYLSSRYKDGTKNYTYSENQIGTDPAAADHNDLGLNFFTRLILEHRYDFVIELGSFNLVRSKRLSKLFPNVRIHALDVTKDFSAERTIDGVIVGPNNLDHIRRIVESIDGRGLLCAHGTLCYYATDDLEQLFHAAYNLGVDVAFSEPNTIGEGSITTSLKRTQISWYHPYLNTLRSIGFFLPDGNGRQIRDCVSKYGEERTFIFARARQISSKN
jgi:hypothetical protein